MTESRLQQTLAAIDHVNSEDANTEVVDGQPQPKELIYGRRMSECLATYAPDASEALQIAARGQHIKRWAIPRDQYPKTRAGYLQWRRELGKFHAEQVAELMGDNGYDEATIDATKVLLTKAQLRNNRDAQTLEDVICLVFIQFYLTGFANTQAPEKLITIVQKTWAKMSQKGQDAALKLTLSDAQKAVIEKALA
ncbi:hypothetical protein NBRC116494_14220 [Aurantivibrio plasticivorans]